MAPTSATVETAPNLDAEQGAEQGERHVGADSDQIEQALGGLSDRPREHA